MVLHHFIHRHSLVFLQVGGWVTYIIIDVLAHHRIGYFFYSQSIVYGLAAFILTSCVALLSQKYRSPNIIFQSIYFVFLLYLTSVIWHKVYVVIHFQMDEPLSVKVSQLFAQSLMEWTQTGYMPLFIFFAWGGLYVGAKWYITHQTQQKELNRALLDIKQAQLLTLRYQLNPHFLFNVLNSIDVSVLNNDKTTAHNMLKYLSNFLRSTLEEGESDKVTLEKEFELIRNFISIEQLRFSDALDLQMDLSDDCRCALIPTMLLQPLVENAIKYAWSQKETGHVTILASKQDKSIKVTIRNNKATGESKVGTGTGLKNTRERLRLLYGADATIAISEFDNNFELIVTLPLEEQL